MTKVLPFVSGAVHKLRLQVEGGRWSKKLTSCKLLYHIECKRGGVGGRKETHIVNVVFKRPLTNSSTEGWATVKIHSCDLPHQRFFLHKD